MLLLISYSLVGKWKRNVAEKGRPSDFKDEFVEQAQALCKLGATDMELADFFKVDVRTIYRWKNSREDFCQAVTCGKDACDDRVERSLYNRAVGYDHEAVKIFMPTGAEKPVYAPYTEHIPPDPGAALNWLKNRRGEVWRDKQTMEVELGEQIVEVLKERRLKAANAG